MLQVLCIHICSLQKQFLSEDISNNDELTQNVMNSIYGALSATCRRFTESVIHFVKL